MPPDSHTVPVHYQVQGEGQRSKPQSSGPVISTDCPECLLLVSVDNLQEHRELAHAAPAHPIEIPE